METQNALRWATSKCKHCTHNELVHARIREQCSCRAIVCTVYNEDRLSSTDETPSLESVCVLGCPVMV
jgi:hypothetical protein